jgi:UDP-3-O-[3-hydroxymyristoyl] glucosamine N-acyltransferase
VSGRGAGSPLGGATAWRGFTLAEIAAHLAEQLGGEEVTGPTAGGELRVTAVRAPEHAGPSDLAVIHHRRYLAAAAAAGALVVPRGVVTTVPAIEVRQPRRALVYVLELFHPRPERRGIEAGARVDPDAVVPASAWVATGARVEAGVVLGERVRLHAGVVVGEGSSLGDDCELFPHVVLYPGTRLGARVRIHAGSVIGADGFGYERSADGWLKIPQVGIVEIGDDVEIGANTTIDRAALEVTRIGAGTKIDNLVQVGHNSELGARVLVAGMVGISGSVKIGADSLLLGQVGIADHVTLEAGTVVGAQAGVHRDLARGEWLGAPAIPVAEARRALPLIARLPEMRRELGALARRLEALEALAAALRRPGSVDPLAAAAGAPAADAGAAPAEPAASVRAPEAAVDPAEP